LSDWWVNGEMDDGLEALIRKIPGYDPIATREDCIFDITLAFRPVEFTEECCCHTKGELAGKHVHLEPWEKAVTLNTFGWVRPDGLRRYREVLLFIPRKNGKSILCASFGNYLFFCDREPGAEIYCAAAEKDQASLVWDMAKQQILYEPALKKRCKIYHALRSLENPRDGSYFKPLSREALTKHGFNAHGVIFDELHTQPNSDMMDVLETSMGSRRQPLMMYLTTSDFDRPNSPCNEKHEYATKVRDGVVKDSTFLPIIYEAKDSDDWTNPETWAKANPNLGVSVSLDYLQRKCQKALEVPSYTNTFKRLHLNIRTRQDVKWISMEHWERCAGTLDPEELKGLRAYCGLDLASTSDLCAFEMYFPEKKAALSFFWLPEETAKKRMDRNRVPYPRWAQEGHIRLTPGNVTDYDFIRNDIVKLGQEYNIIQIAIDRWNSTQLQTQLSGEGFDVMPFGQGFASMSAPAKELERLVLSNGIFHFDNPVLTWCCSNVMIELDGAGNIKPSKKKSAEKIDGVVALVMALGAAMLNEDSGEKSVYDEGGIVFL